MAHPYHHSVSSAQKFGGVAADYQAIHDWFDASKSVFADYRHRALRHHLEGVDFAIRIFGCEIVNSDGGAVPTREIGLQHLMEDCGFHPQAHDWWEGLGQRSPAVRREISRDAAAASSVKRWGGVASDYVAIHELIDEKPKNAGDWWFALRHHSWGCFDAERKFGATVQNSRGQEIPVRVLAENHVRDEFGSVPAVADWLRAIRGVKWMVSAAREHHPMRT